MTPREQADPIERVGAIIYESVSRVAATSTCIGYVIRPLSVGTQAWVRPDPREGNPRAPAPTRLHTRLHGTLGMGIL